MPVFGTVAPGYESVRERFERHVSDGMEDCAQVCAFVHGELVVDIYGYCTKGAQTDYGASCIQNIFSSSKVITSIVVAMLADRGCLSYNQRVSELWPEYGQHGKEDTTV